MRLLADGASVTAYDDLSLGRREHLAAAIATGRCALVEADLLDAARLRAAMSGHDAVFHLAANSDIALGREQTDRDLRQGTLATFDVLDAMRATPSAMRARVDERRVGDASAGGEPREDAGPLLPISLYGASKLASEALVSAFAHNFACGDRSSASRTLSAAAQPTAPCTDFIRKLRRNPRELEVLGDGRQAKPYLYVDDCVDGMLFGWRTAGEEVNVFNLGVDGATSVAEIAGIVRENMGLPAARLVLAPALAAGPATCRRCGWIRPSLATLGWRARRSSTEAVREGVRAALRDVTPDDASHFR